MEPKAILTSGRTPCCGSGPYRVNNGPWRCGGCGSSDGFLVVEEAAYELQRLRDGLAERGILTGRNPDGVEQTVDTVLLVIDEQAAALAKEKRADA